VIVMGVVTLVPMPFDGPVFEMVIGAMAALAGVLAVRSAAGSMGPRLDAGSGHVHV
jgi:hypothetical protein